MVMVIGSGEVVVIIFGLVKIWLGVLLIVWSKMMVYERLLICIIMILEERLVLVFKFVFWVCVVNILKERVWYE